jgi:uncharacterized protein YjbI with pentapeptide repeats
MAKTLKNLVECYRKGECSTPNIQVIDEIFSDEMIILPDNVLLNLTFSRAFFENSRLTKIRFCNGSFGSSFFKDCFLENCIFSNIHFREMKSLKCIFKDCLFMDCIFVDTDISETIFESCTFSKGSVDGSEFQSCHFINTVFRDVTFGFASLIDSKFSNSKKSIEFEGEVYFNDIFDQIDEFLID